MPLTMSYGAPAPAPEKPAKPKKAAAAKSTPPATRRDALKNKAEALFDPATETRDTDAG